MATEFSTTDKPATFHVKGIKTFHVKNVKKKRDQRRPDERKLSANGGRPGKRTPQLEKDLLAALETGAPYRIACLACGISDDSFANWRRKDPEFADRVNKAAGKTALRLLKKIEKNADENFSAAAWLLERRFPESFSRYGNSTWGCYANQFDDEQHDCYFGRASRRACQTQCAP